jgi:hypothetical protein
VAEERRFFKSLCQGTALVAVLGLGIGAGALVSATSGISLAGASSTANGTCQDATQPVGGYAAPTGPPPSSDASTMADWSGQSLPVSDTGNFEWTSSTIQITGVPNSIVLVTKVVGGQVAYSTPLEVTPIEVGAGSSPGTFLAAIRVSGNVTCISGTPSVLLWEARAESSGPAPGTGS